MYCAHVITHVMMVRDVLNVLCTRNDTHDDTREVLNVLGTQNGTRMIMAHVMAHVMMTHVMAHVRC